MKSRITSITADRAARAVVVRRDDGRATKYRLVSDASWYRVAALRRVADGAVVVGDGRIAMQIFM